MAEEREQLRISAELDTSKLKQEAKKGMQEVVNEEKKVEQQSRQTSKAVDDIGTKGKDAGNALQDAGSKGTQAIKQVGKEAEKTASKISDIDKSVKNLKLGQAIGVASRLANSDIGRGIGSAVGNSLGMSGSEMGMAGNALQGGLQGAAMGAMVAGPWGAVVGGLAGAATGLIQAADEQKKAARELAKSGEQRAGAILKENLKKELAKDKEEEFNRIAADPFKMVKSDFYPNREEKEVTAVQGAIDKAKWEIDGYKEEIQDAIQALKDLNSINISNYSPEDVADHNASIEKEAQAYEEYSARLEEATKRLAAFEALQAQLDNLPVGPEIPDIVKAQRDAEANATVGPEIPPEILAQREAEAKAQEQFNKELRKNWLKEMGDSAKALQNEAKEKLASVNGMAGMKLTDSLTQIGGGAGYGAQMQGISNYVQKVVSEVKNLNKTADSILNKMDKIKNEGVFTGEE